MTGIVFIIYLNFRGIRKFLELATYYSFMVYTILCV